MVIMDAKFVVQNTGNDLGWCIGNVSDLGTFYFHSDGEWREWATTEAKDGTLAHSGYYPSRAAAEMQLRQFLAGSIAARIVAAIKEDTGSS